MIKVKTRGKEYDSEYIPPNGASLEDRCAKAEKLRHTKGDVDRTYSRLHICPKSGELQFKPNESMVVKPDEVGYETKELRFLADLDGDDRTWAIKRKLRYWCYRFRNEATGGCPAMDPKRDDCLPKEAKKFRADVEAQEWFIPSGGWPGFAVRWDLDWADPANLGKVKKRRTSVWKEWERDLAQKVPVMPTTK